MKRKQTLLLLGIVAVVAFIARSLLSFNALDFPERFCRPDTMTYLGPAQALLEGKFFGTGRAPGYIVFAAFFKWISVEYHLFLLALAGAFLGTFTIFPIFAAAKELAGRNCALTAAALWGLNLTALANASMILSDTLFAFFAACQFAFFIRYFRRKKSGDGRAHV